MSAPSGPGTHIREVINGLEENGHEVIRIIAGGEKPVHQKQNIIIQKRWWKKFIPKYVWQTLKDISLLNLDRKLEIQLNSVIQIEKPDVIYERAYYLMGSGYRAAQKNSIKYCCEINAPYPEEKTTMNGRSILLHRAIRNERKQVQASYKVFVVSSALKAYLENKISGVNHKIIVTPNAVNPSYIHASSNGMIALTNKLGIIQNEKTIGFVGSIFPYHGVDALIETFATLLHERQVKMKLIIVGDGEILEQLKNRVSELGIQNYVIFTGNVPHRNVYDYINLMDIAVMARSNWYGSPVKIFEYGIMKKSIIAPDVVPVRDVMKNGEDGLLIDDKLDALKLSLEYFLDHPIEAERMAQAFHLKVSQEHTWKNVSDRILKEIQ